MGFEFQGYAFGFDVFTLYLPPQIFGQMRQVSGGLRERQVFWQGDFGGNLKPLAVGLDGTLVHAARQVVEAVAVSAEKVEQLAALETAQIACGPHTERLHLFQRNLAYAGNFAQWQCFQEGGGLLRRQDELAVRLAPVGSDFG